MKTCAVLIIGALLLVGCGKEKETRYLGSEDTATLNAAKAKGASEAAIWDGVKVAQRHPCLKVRGPGYEINASTFMVKVHVDIVLKDPDSRLATKMIDPLAKAAKKC